MNKSYRWTKSGARLQLMNSNLGIFNWLFLPGHFPWIENPKEVQTIFQEFLSRMGSLWQSQ